MIYRIIFNPMTASWQIELQRFGFLWKPIMTSEGQEPAIRQFETYDSAGQYVTSKGIDKVYRNWSTRPAFHVMQGYPPVGASAYTSFQAPQ